MVKVFLINGKSIHVIFLNKFSIIQFSLIIWTSYPGWDSFIYRSMTLIIALIEVVFFFTDLIKAPLKVLICFHSLVFQCSGTAVERCLLPNVWTVYVKRRMHLGERWNRRMSETVHYEMKEACKFILNFDYLFSPSTKLNHQYK